MTDDGTDNINPPSKIQSIQTRLEQAQQRDAPVFYANGFTASMGVGDVVLVLDRNGEPSAVLNMSFTLAKTLALSLNQVIEALEQNTGTTIMTTHEIAEKMGRNEND